MAEAITIARPYAAAVFAIANDKGELKVWSELLALLAQAVAVPSMQSVIGSPSVSNDQVLTLLAEIGGELMSEDAQHFLAVLAENKRLQLLEHIVVTFEELRAEAEKVMMADVTSAQKLTVAQEKDISAALKARLGRNVTLNTSIDKNLLGGAIIRAGDLIIDGSALGKLNRLTNAVS